MKKNAMFIIDISKKEFPIKDKVSGKAVRNPIFTLIQNYYPDFDKDKFISVNELNLYWEKYISNYLFVEIGALSNLETKVIDTLKRRCFVSKYGRG